jgi:hypothetical protein
VVRGVHVSVYHDEAQAAAAMARRRKAQAVGDARRAGVTIDALVSAPGVSRQTVFDWTVATAPSAFEEESK